MRIDILDLFMSRKEQVWKAIETVCFVLSVSLSVVVTMVSQPSANRFSATFLHHLLRRERGESYV